MSGTLNARKAVLAALVPALWGLSGEAAGAQPSAENRSFFCVSEMSTGFIVDEITSEWRVTRFNDTQFLVRPARSGEFVPDRQLLPEGVIPYVVLRFGQDVPVQSCRAGFNRIFDTASSRALLGDPITIDTNTLYCVSDTGTFQMDVENLRYTRTYTYGFFSQSPDATQISGDTPLIELGSCAPM